MRALSPSQLRSVTRAREKGRYRRGDFAMVLRQWTHTEWRRPACLERIHAQARLERRSFRDARMAEKGSRHCPTDRTFRRRSNLSMPTKAACQADHDRAKSIGRTDHRSQIIFLYSSSVSIRSARPKSSSVKPPLLCVERTRRTLL